METKYLIRPVLDSYDFVEYFEFVRIADDAILYSSSDYDSICMYASGFCDAKNSTFKIL